MNNLSYPLYDNISNKLLGIECTIDNIYPCAVLQECDNILNCLVVIESIDGSAAIFDHELMIPHSTIGQSGFMSLSIYVKSKDWKDNHNNTLGISYKLNRNLININNIQAVISHRINDHIVLNIGHNYIYCIDKEFDKNNFIIGDYVTIENTRIDVRFVSWPRTKHQIPILKGFTFIENYEN